MELPAGSGIKNKTMKIIKINKKTFGSTAVTITEWAVDDQNRLHVRLNSPRVITREFEPYSNRYGSETFLLDGGRVIGVECGETPMSIRDWDGHVESSEFASQYLITN